MLESSARIRRGPQFHERDRIPVIHRDYEAIPLRIVGHRGGVRDAGGDEFRLLTRTDAANCPLPDAADVLRPVGQDRQASLPAS